MALQKIGKLFHYCHAARVIFTFLTDVIGKSQGDIFHGLPPSTAFASSTDLMTDDSVAPFEGKILQMCFQSTEAEVAALLSDLDIHRRQVVEAGVKHAQTEGYSPDSRTLAACHRQDDSRPICDTGKVEIVASIKRAEAISVGKIKKKIDHDSLAVL
ncbi:Hypothetical protein NTJ_07247 [Nesidiocoris tenuis]|uniref:Uncharacterized protein n=1 Tax=Nesidiocoris tenuis TaxID=355587 RepID=A0ABN7AQF1_9HEMI|nr:Hypothetical protein NTJ_07247 [Nesidiocoris tenuis]